MEPARRVPPLPAHASQGDEVFATGWNEPGRVPRRGTTWFHRRPKSRVAVHGRAFCEVYRRRIARQARSARTVAQGRVTRGEDGIRALAPGAKRRGRQPKARPNRRRVTRGEDGIRAL